MRNITFLFLAILGFPPKNLGGNRFSREICRSEKTLTLGNPEIRKSGNRNLKSGNRKSGNLKSEKSEIGNPEIFVAWEHIQHKHKVFYSNY